MATYRIDLEFLTTLFREGSQRQFSVTQGFVTGETVVGATVSGHVLEVHTDGEAGAVITLETSGAE